MSAARRRRKPAARDVAGMVALPPSVSDRVVLGMRNGTTAALIASGRLRAIPWGRRFRVLRADVERLAGEGFSPDGGRPRAPRRKPPGGAGVAAQILAIQIPDRRQP